MVYNESILSVNKMKAIYMSNEKTFISHWWRLMAFAEIITYLGVILNYKLAFKNHIEHVSNWVGKILMHYVQN